MIGHSDDRLGEGEVLHRVDLVCDERSDLIRIVLRRAPELTVDERSHLGSGETKHCTNELEVRGVCVVGVGRITE